MERHRVLATRPRSSAITSTAPPRRTRARRGQGDRLREEILAAAERLLIETGNESAVSIRAVADAVGVTAPSIYLHFADKSDLVFAVCEEHFARCEAAAQEAIAGVEDPVERIYRRGRAYVRFGLDNPEHYRIMFMSRSDEPPPRFADEGIAVSAAFGGLVEDVTAAAASGKIVADDPFLVACGLWATVHGITSLVISKPFFPWPPSDQLVDHALAVIGRGLGAV